MKKHLRKQYIQRRQALSPEESQARSKVICTHLLNWIQQGGFREVCLFLPYKGEPDLSGLSAVDGLGLILGLPVVSEVRGEMWFYRWEGQGSLVKNRYGILEPDLLAGAKPLVLSCSAVVLVPALAVDRQGARLGYGGGYYDRFLMKHPQVTSVGVVFGDFFVSQLPCEEHDWVLDYIATEKGLYSRKA